MAWEPGAGLEDRGVVVTGAAGGIGSAVAAAFARAGARVCAVDVDQAAADAVIARLDHPERHVAHGIDLTDLSSHGPLLETARAQLGSVVALAHLAAVLVRAPDVDAVTEDDWDRQLDTNLKATFFLNRAAAALFRAQGSGGAIVNFASQGWWTGGFGGSVVYAASKGGVVSMSRGLARTWAKDGIRVNVVAPGAVDTPMMRDGMTPAALEEFLRMVPVGRMADPSELGGAVVFLCSPHASYITGATLVVAGGQLMY